MQKRLALRVGEQEEKNFVEADQRGRRVEIAMRGLDQRASQERARTRAAGALEFVESVEKFFWSRLRHAVALTYEVRNGSIKEDGARHNKKRKRLFKTT